LHWEGNIADPSVVEVDRGYVAVGTGIGLTQWRARGARGPWKPLAAPLTTMPSWVLPGEIWAPDLAPVAGGWALYYSAPAAGLNPGGRCIGAAFSTLPTGPFTPVGEVPLVCPARVGQPPAEDQLANRSGLPASGVIDASLFTERDGRHYLLYKTQGTPSSIRMVPLTPDGLHAAAGTASKMLVRSGNTIENPTLIRQTVPGRGSQLVLLTSEGWYGSCDYRTTWRVSTSRWRWPAQGATLLGPAGTGVCGPGGADVVQPRDGGKARLFFHGWLCFQTDQACPRGFRVDRDGTWLPNRALYGATLTWSRSGAPSIESYLVGR